MTATDEGERRPIRSAAVRTVLRRTYRAIERSRLAPVLKLGPLQRAHRRITETRVQEDDVLEILALLNGTETKLHGGWACDALLGAQTREHEDLDLLVPVEHRQRALDAVRRNGFELIYTLDAPDLTELMELTDHRGRRSVALHFADYESETPGTWRAAMRARIAAAGLEAGELFARGVVGGGEVECLSAPAQLALHTGYKPTENDRHDVRLLCARFSLPLPTGYDDAVRAP